MKEGQLVFFFRHPLASPTKPGRWPFRARFEGESPEGKVEREGFLYLDGRGPGVLNSNQDPCVLSDPLPWFLAHCRIDSGKKEHNRISIPERGKEGLLSEVTAPGDRIIFGGVLFSGAEECLACGRPCGRAYLFVDTVFGVKGTIELPLREVEGGYEHALGTPEGYATFRKAAEELGIRLPAELLEFRESPAWRYNLADTEGHHRLVDYRPYRMILAEEGASYIPLSEEEPPARCPFLAERPGLWWAPWEEIGLPAPEELFPEVKGGKRRGVAVLPREAGERLISLIEARTNLKVTRVKRIFHLKPQRGSFRVTVSEVLRRLGYSQREVASWGTIQFLTLNKISRGETPPTLRTLDRIARTVGVGIKDLFEDPVGETRDLFHRIAGCAQLEAALEFEDQGGPCARVPKDLGVKKPEEAPRPEPWVGELAETRVILVTRSPSWQAVRSALSHREYPVFSSKWFPGRVEEYFSSRMFFGRALFEDSPLRRALEELQILVGPEPDFPAPAVTYLRHCAGGNEKALEACAARFFPEIIEATRGTLVVLPEAAAEAEKYLRHWVEVFREEAFAFLARPAGDEAPLLEGEAPPRKDGWQRILFGSRQSPQLAVILKNEGKLPEEYLNALRFHLLNCGVAAFKIWALFVREKIEQSLFEKIQACPEIRRYLRGERVNPCGEVFRSYRGVSLRDIFRPLPWAGKLTEAPLLFVGFKPPLKKTDYPHYEKTSTEEVRSLFENIITGDEAPFPQIRRLLGGFLGFQSPLPELGKYCAYIPIVQCRNTINEGNFPFEVFRTCRDRYFPWKLVLSPAKMVVVLGRKASLAVQEVLSLEVDPARAFVYHAEELEKTFIFLPLTKKGIEEQLSEEDRKQLASIREELLRKIVFDLLLKQKSSPKKVF